MWLDYVVRFQNTGNDTAFNVYIPDTLSHWLDNANLQILTSSDDYEASFLDTNVIEFRFDNILLPDSTLYEPNSHGHIAYRIRSTGGMSYSDTIYNGASIFFDYNEPVLTNYSKNYIELVTGVEAEQEQITSVYPNPNNGSFIIDFEEPVEQLKAYDLKGTKVPIRWNRDGSVIGCLIESIPSGVYILELLTAKGIFHSKVVIQTQ